MVIVKFSEMPIISIKATDFILKKMGKNNERGVYYYNKKRSFKNIFKKKDAVHFFKN